VVKIKICGFQDSENALAAARAGADFLGLVFAPGRRQISPLRAREIARLVRTLNPRPRLAGVFAGHTEDEVNRLVNYCLLDAAQLSGDDEYRRIADRVYAELVKRHAVSSPQYLAPYLADLAARSGAEPKPEEAK